MELRGTAEDELAGALTRRELVTLNRLLKKLTLLIESDRSPRARWSGQ
jgi:hypothetical protein